MKCKTARDLLFRKIDAELSGDEDARLEEHLAGCASCLREYRLLRIPSLVARSSTPITPSPWFCQGVRARIEEESPGMALWTSVQTLAHRMIPTLAGVTLALLAAFAYLQMRAPDAALFRDYDGVYLSDDQSHRMLVAEQTDITYESVLTAIASR
ncbi:MAG: zf-HC2 domain-containing protein [Acidobacteria bacterium]|nr:zf-HC2 domain-containing protein [Acidobacteriota bacterium]